MPVIRILGGRLDGKSYNVPPGEMPDVLEVPTAPGAPNKDLYYPAFVKDGVVVYALEGLLERLWD